MLWSQRATESTNDARGPVAIALHQRVTAALCLGTAVLPFLLLVLLAAPARGQDTLQLARLTGPVVVDGRVDEPAW